MIPSLRKIQNDVLRARERRQERLRRKRAKSTRRSFLEQLEDRRVLATLTVTTEADGINPEDGLTSLREAIQIANTNGEADTIRFASGVTTITVHDLAMSGNWSDTGLNLTETGPDKKTTIQGPVTITPDSHAFSVSKGVFAEFSRLEITGGSLGAIQNEGQLVIHDSTIYGNGRPSNTSAAAIYANTGRLTIFNSTISGNWGYQASALLVTGGTVEVANSTLTGNISSLSGAVHIAGYDDISVSFFNSIIAGNFRGSSSTPSDLGGKPLSTASSNNLVGDASTSGGLTDGTNGNIVGVSDISRVLGPLTDNGGGVLTHALVGTSASNPAIDAGDYRLFPLATDDQRGQPRIAGEGVDIGAVEALSSSARDFVDIGDIRFVTSGVFSTSTDGTRRSNGVVGIGLRFNDLSDFKPALVLRGGVEIRTDGSGKSVFTTNGYIAGLSQGKLVNLMKGLVDDDPNQKIQVPVADLSIANGGYSIALSAPQQAIESRVSENLRFKPSNLSIHLAGLDVSGFLAFDVLNGAGIQLGPVFGLRLLPTETKALVPSGGYLPLRTATNRQPSGEEPIVANVGNTNISFASPQMFYDDVANEFHLTGTGRIAFDTGSAEIKFGDDANSTLLIDGSVGRINLDKTTNARVTQFTISGLTFTTKTGFANTVDLNFGLEQLTFHGQYDITTDDDTSALSDARPKVDFTTLSGDGLTWSLSKGQVLEDFDFEVGEFKVGTLPFRKSSDYGVLRLYYNRLERRYEVATTLREDSVDITPTIVGDGAQTKITLTVGLPREKGVYITNGRVDAFQLPIRKFDVGAGNEFEALTDFRAAYNPLTQQLQILGTAYLKGFHEVTHILVDFGSAATTKTVLNTDTASTGKIVYKLASIRADNFEFVASNLESTYDVITAKASHKGSGSWQSFSNSNGWQLENDGFVTTLESEEPEARRSLFPVMRLDGTLKVTDGLPLKVTGMRLELGKYEWLLKSTVDTDIRVQVDGNYVSVSTEADLFPLRGKVSIPALGDKPSKLIVKDGIFVAGMWVSGGEITFSPSAGFSYNSTIIGDKEKYAKVQDVVFDSKSGISFVSLGLSRSADGTLSVLSGRLLFGGVRLALQGIQFASRITGDYDPFTRSFRLTASGTYDGFYTVRFGFTPPDGDLLIQNGAVKLKNFTPPDQRGYSIGGIELTASQLGTPVPSPDGRERIYTGPHTINVAGTYLPINLGDAGTRGLVVSAGENNVTEVSGTIVGKFTVGGVLIEASSKVSYDAKNDILRVQGPATLTFQAIHSISIPVDLDLEIIKGQVNRLTAEFRNTGAVNLLGISFTFKSGGFSFNREAQEYSAWGEISLRTVEGLFNNGVSLRIGSFDERTGVVHKPGLIIRQGKLESIDIEIDTAFNLFGFSANADLLLQYNRPTGRLRLVGGLGLTIPFGVRTVGAEGTLGLDINTNTGSVNIDEVSFSAKGFTIGVVGVDELTFKFKKENGTTTISASGEVTLPGGVEVGAGFELRNGRLNAIHVSGGGTPGIPLGKTGVFLQKVKGSITGIADLDNLAIKLEVTGSFGPTFNILGTRVNLVQMVGSIEFTRTKATLSGDVNLLGGLLSGSRSLAGGRVSIHYAGRDAGKIEVSGHLDAYSGFLTGEVSFVYQHEQIVGTFGISVQIPRLIPFIGGYRIGYAEIGINIWKNCGRCDWEARIHIDLGVNFHKIFKGRLYAEVNVNTGILRGFVEENGIVGQLVDFGSSVVSKATFGLFGGGRPSKKSFVVNLLFFRDLDLDIPFDVTGVSSVDVPAPTLTIGDVTLDPAGPGGTISFTGYSQLPDTTTIKLFVDSDGAGYDGQLIATGLAVGAGQQIYHWSDLAAYAAVAHDPDEKLYVYGRIYDGASIPVASNYSAAITPPNFSPAMTVPGEQKFGTNQQFVFSNNQQNAISFSDPLADYDPDAELVVTLGVNVGTLTLDPQQATPWTNINNATDVDGRNGTEVSDAMQLISMLNNAALQAAGGKLPSRRSRIGTPMLDVNGDGKITVDDAAALTDPLLNPATGPTSNFVAPNVLIEGDGTGRLQLIGTAAEINRLLDGLTYQAFENSFFDDRLEVTANRFPELSPIILVDSIPLTAQGLTVGGIEFLPVSYEQGSGAAQLLGDFQIASVMSGHIQSAMIAIDGYDAENDVLHLSQLDQQDLGIKASFDAATGTLYLTGGGLIDHYQRAIERTTFSSNGTGNRFLRVQLGDGASNVASGGVAVYIIAMNQAPLLTTGLGSTYVAGSSTAVSLLPSITVQDPDSATLRRAVITLDANSYQQGEDVLTYTAADDITGRFNALTGQLILSGESSPAAWSAALRRVQYRNTQATATPGIRQISITVDDGQAMNSTSESQHRLLVVAATTTLQTAGVGNLPTQTATEINDDGSITLAAGLTLTPGSEEIDSLVRVDVAFTDNYIAGSDFLSVDGLLPDMHVSYDAMNGVLTITGNVPIAAFEHVLRSVNYSNRSLVHDGRARTITFTVFDGFTAPASKSMTARFEALPVVQAGMELLVYTTGQSTQPLDSNISVMYAGGDMLTGATVEFVYDYLRDQDRLLFTNQNGITGNFDVGTGVLTLTGSATVAQYQAALRSVQYTNTRTNPITSLKQLGVYVQDDDTFSEPTYVLLVVNTEQVAPTVNVTTTAIGFTEGNAPIEVAANLTINEQNAALEDGRGTVYLTSAAVFIDGYVKGEDVLTFEPVMSAPDADGLTFVIVDGEFDVESGLLYLFGRATPDQYQTALRSVLYQNVSAAPSTHPRELLISVAQGIAFADAPPITVTVTSLNDPPTRIVAPPASATMLENASFGSLGLEGINYAPPHQQQPYVVVTVSNVPDAALGTVQLSTPNGAVAATVGGVYSLDQIRSAVFVPALNATGTGTFEFTVAGWNPILDKPDPAHLTESISIEVAGVETSNPGGAFVAQTFRDLLGRNPTQEELDALNARFTFDRMSDESLRRDVVAEIQGSGEYRQRVVTAAYQRLLDRAPTQEELAAWLAPSIAEDFSSEQLPASLEINDYGLNGAASVVFLNGGVIFSDASGTPVSLRTVGGNVLSQNLTAEVTVSIPENSADPTISELGFFSTPGFARKVHVVGNTAYVGEGFNLRVLDVSNPANPIELGSFATPQNVYEVQVVGNKAFIANQLPGVRVLDVTDPANITSLGVFDTPGSAVELQVVGNTAYVADNNSGLRVMDVTDPANIKSLGLFDTPGVVMDVHVVGNTAFLADGDRGLRVLDVSNPANITELGSFDTSGFASQVQMVGTTAYLADRERGLRVLNVSNPANITELGFFDPSYDPIDVEVVGSTAYLAGYSGGLRVLDIRDPANIRELAFFDTTGNAADVEVIGGTVYVADGNSGLRVLNVQMGQDAGHGAAYFGLETADGLQNIRLSVAANQNSSAGLDSTSAGGAGTHRLQARWNAFDQTVVFAIDEDYAGGDFVADHTFQALSAFDPNLDANINLNHVYFGSGANTSFDDFVVTFNAPPLDAVNNQIISSDEYFTSQPPNTIRGYNWHDLNANGERDRGEPGLAGWDVQLIDSTGTVVRTQTTDHEGRYSFTGVGNGAYVVQVVPQATWQQTYPSYQTTLTTSSAVRGHWDYQDFADDGNHVPGPGEWSQVAPTVLGDFQSPVDVPTGTPAVDLDAFWHVDYRTDVPLEKLFNNGHSVEAEIDQSPENRLILGGEEFQLAQFHFHMGSEHTVGGQREEMELHLVHKHVPVDSADPARTGLAVIGVRLTVADEAPVNAALTPIFAQLPFILNKGDTLLNMAGLDLNALLPSNHNGWFYEGSLTTPPGSQGVNWFLLQEAVEISPEEFAAFTALANHDASHQFDPGYRPTQPLNGRQFNRFNHEITVDGSVETIFANFGSYQPTTTPDANSQGNGTAASGGTNESFVRAAYADLLHREPTAQELGEATALLEAGNTSRADIAGQIEFSDEGTAILAEQMIGFLLRRTGSRAEIEDLAVQVQEFGREAVLNALVASNEYYVRYGTQTSAASRSAEEIEASEAELIRRWLEGTPTVGNSQVTTDFDAVGTINTDGRAHAGGTLIAPQYVLTAAHLVAGKDIDSLTFSVGLTNYGLDEVYVHPDYANEFLGTDAGNDLAILKLNRPVIDVEPAALWGGKLYLGDELTLVGFGPHPGDDGFGTKRAGTTPIDGLTRNLVTWTYDGAEEATTVPGDSGSPQFLQMDGTWYVASLTSGGTHQALSRGDFAYNTRVAAYADWINQVTAGAAQGLDSASHGGAAFGGSSRGIHFVAFDSHQNIELSGNHLLIQDISINGEGNLFYISTTATEVVISDAYQKLTTAIAGAAGNNSHTIKVPLSSFTGNIVVRSAGGDDVIDVTTPSRRVDIDAGDGRNSLVVNGSDSSEAEEFFVRASSAVRGSLEVAMPTATTGGPYTVQATGIHSLELKTGAGNDTVRPQSLSGLTTPIDSFTLNLGDGDDTLDGVNSTTSMIADGGDGNDTLVGGTANDRLSGGYGDDSLAGGPGDDTYVFDVDDFIGFDTVTENAGGGPDTLDFSPTHFTSVGIDLRQTDAGQSVTTNNNLILRLSDHIENVIGGSHGNAIIGDEGANILKGGSGLDFILGAGGADQIFGGGSVDTLQGSSEASIDGGDGADITMFSGSAIAFPTNLLPIFHIAGKVAGTDYDQVRVPGDGRTVTLGGDLEVYLAKFTPQPGDKFTIVDLQAASSVLSGTFLHKGQPLSEGGSFTADGHRFSISYVAGDGNDIALTYVERLSGLTLSITPGDHNIAENLTGLVAGQLLVEGQDPAALYQLSVADARFEIVAGKLKLKPDNSVRLADGTTVVVSVTAKEVAAPGREATESFTFTVAANPRPWRNPVNAEDSNDDGHVVPLDALLIINELNGPTIRGAEGKLPETRAADSTITYFDVNGDGFCTAIDVLQIINLLNAQRNAEGEPTRGVSEANRLGRPSFVLDAGTQTNGLRPETVPGDRQALAEQQLDPSGAPSHTGVDRVLEAWSEPDLPPVVRDALDLLTDDLLAEVCDAW